MLHQRFNHINHSNDLLLWRITVMLLPYTFGQLCPKCSKITSVVCNNFDMLPLVCLVYAIRVKKTLWKTIQELFLCNT
ncbi:unnamed protein product [Callosobruchus maculatus]|uniref:Uncharacterized protein n=1 Tax=Callosobruchus maculatus TaxID=64391 RepID=A0A653CF53_CALMS|nr:unnamed protein product [Callosobruchus maculatus]